ncbi:MAG: sugar-binding domain-containing protein [Oscillospiraceae bacterium]|jgi:deoxyribonucleoside regulator|nr:sugar-binding domain-containing protein [Oscillospiraceae bacterium]
MWDTVELGREIAKRFDLSHVLVVPSVSRDDARNLQETVRRAAPFFQNLVRNGDKIGVAWGATLLALSKRLHARQLSESTVFQITGNLDNADSNTYAHEIMRHFSQKMMLKALHTLPCPIIVENSFIIDLLKHDSKISGIMSQINQVDMVFPNIGVMGQENCLWSTGYVSSDMMLSLEEKGSVGCVCSRFINDKGEIVDSLLNERTIGIALSALRTARYSCACVTASKKVPPLLGCLRSGLVNVLAIDTNTAVTLLECAQSYTA